MRSGRTGRRRAPASPRSLYFLKLANVPQTPRVPPSVSPRRRPELRALDRRDGHDGADPVAHRPGDQPDPRGRQGEPRAPRRRGAARRACCASSLTVFRRLIAGRVSLGVERDLRHYMYEHLQSLELAFFDGQQTGQLMSRATVDLQAVRFFLGYGLLFMLQSALTIVLAAVAMFVVNPALAAISLAPVPFVVLVAQRYGQALAPGDAGGPAADRRADRRGRGERLRRARRQGLRRRGPPARALRACRSGASSSRRSRPPGSRPSTARSSASCRRSASPRSCFIGGREVINGSLTLGAFTAFYTYLLMLISPMRTLGISLGMAQRATASGARLFQILDRAPLVTAQAGRAAAARPATGTSSCAT